MFTMQSSHGHYRQSGSSAKQTVCGVMWFYGLRNPGRCCCRHHCCFRYSVSLIEHGRHQWKLACSVDTEPASEDFSLCLCAITSPPTPHQNLMPLPSTHFLFLCEWSWLWQQMRGVCVCGMCAYASECVWVCMQSCGNRGMHRLDEY